MSNMLDRIRNRRVQEEKVIPSIPLPSVPHSSSSLVYDVVGSKEDKKLKKRLRPTTSTFEASSSYEQSHIVFDEWAGESIEIKDFFAVQQFTKTNKESFTRWDTNLWLEEAAPKTWEELQDFADEASAEMGDRGKAATNFRQVLRAVQNTIDNKTQKLHLLIGGTCGKSMILRLLAKHYKLELISVQEDENVPKFLKDASAQGLDDTKRLWVLEHFDLLSFNCIMKLVPRLLKTGPVFATARPDMFISAENKKRILISEVFSWSDAYKLKYLEKFGPPINMKPFLDENGTIPGALNFAQLGANRGTSLSFCGLADCNGCCDSCLLKKRIPTNLRFLVEDTVCNRSTLAKCNLLTADADKSIVLLQEMVPMVASDRMIEYENEKISASDLKNVARLQQTFSFLDLVGFSTIIKDAFLDNGLIQSYFATKVSFSSGSDSEMSLMFWKLKKKKEEDEDEEEKKEEEKKEEDKGKKKINCKREKPTEVQLLRGAKKRLVDEDGEADNDYDWDDPMIDLRNMHEEYSLFAQARGRPDPFTVEKNKIRVPWVR